MRICALCSGVSASTMAMGEWYKGRMNKQVKRADIKARLKKRDGRVGITARLNKQRRKWGAI